MTSAASVAFLLDVDNTLLNGDRVVADWKDHLRQAFDDDQLAQYWTIFQERRAELGYVDYLDALQGYRVDNPRDQHCARISAFLLDYPFDELLYPAAFDLIERLRGWGPTVIVSDGDVVYQPRKVERSGLYHAVEGRVLLYIHKEKELEDVERQYPASHYVLVDDKPRILAAVKQVWGCRVTTVFPCQGHYAHDAESVAKYPAPDITIERIGDLLKYDLPALLEAASTAGVSGSDIGGSA
jgi:FMN phosphatase YigB (HAD superfamily)